MKYQWRLLTLGFLILLFASCAQVEVDVTGTVSGSVKDYTTRKVIQNCQVSISPNGGQKLTDASGRYVSDPLEAGTYTLTFTCVGYYDQSMEVKIPAGGNTTCDVLLESKNPIELTPSILDFGDYAKEMSFSVENHTAEKCDISLNYKEQWINFSKTRASIEANSKITITAQVDRSKMSDGEHTAKVEVSYTNGNEILEIRAVKATESKPQVETKSASDITANSFKIGGAIKATGGVPITAYGHCWSTTSNPTIQDQKTNLGETTTTSEYVSEITQNLVNTIVYVRAYATNKHGTSYGQEIQVTSQSEDPDPEDPNPEDPNPEDPNPEDPDPEDPNPEDPNPEEETPPQENVFAGGSGAAYDPYQINSREQMQKMKDYASSHFKLVADIDMDGIQWIPVKLTGGFDGDDHRLYNLTISPYVATDNQGLFSELAYGASVKNLTIDGFSVNAPNRSYIGAIAGKASSSSVISNCHVVLKKASAVVGDSYIGGIAGEVYEMADCSVSSSVSSPVIAGNSIVGGAAGNFTNDRSSAKIERVTVSCNIYGDGYVGGIVGRHKSYGTLTECAYKGTISTGNNSSYIGGIIGYSECTMLACKADAKISVSSGSRYVGGIVGYRIMILAACYSTGEITGVTPTLRNYIGAISGDVSGSKCVHCYSTLNLKMDGSAKTSETGTDSYTVASLLADFGTNINLAEIMRATNSSYASYWNYDKTWQWTGTINGESVTAICPKLSWEK